MPAIARDGNKGIASRAPELSVQRNPDKEALS